MAIQNELYEDIYYLLGDYIYNIINPKIDCDVDMFKYIIGKLFFGDFNTLPKSDSPLYT